MCKFLLPISLLVFFSVFLILRGQSEEDPVEVASTSSQVAQEKATTVDSGTSTVTATAAFDFAGLRDEYLAVFGIMVMSVVLAMRRRPHLGLGNRRR